MSIMSDALTPPSGFPRSLMSYVQYASYLGNPLVDVGYDMIDIVELVV